VITDHNQFVLELIARGLRGTLVGRVSAIELAAAYRRILERLLVNWRGGPWEPCESLHRHLVGRREMDDDDLSIGVWTPGRRERGYRDVRIVDLLIRCPALGLENREYGIRFTWNERETRERRFASALEIEGVANDLFQYVHRWRPRRSPTVVVQRTAGWDSALMGIAADRVIIDDPASDFSDRVRAAFDINQADAFTYAATAQPPEKQDKAERLTVRELARKLGIVAKEKPRQCVECGTDAKAEYSARQPDGTHKSGYCERCWLATLPPCLVCGDRIHAEEQRTTVTERTAYADPGQPVTVHLRCSPVFHQRVVAVDLLFSVIAKIADAVAVGMAAGLSLAGEMATLRGKYGEAQHVCAVHGLRRVGGVAQVHEQPGSAHVVTTYVCTDCAAAHAARRERELLVRSATLWTFGLMLECARYLWSTFWDPMDDLQKRALLLEVSDDPPEKYRESFFSSSPATSAVDVQLSPVVEELLLEME